MEKFLSTELAAGAPFRFNELTPDGGSP